MQLAGKTNDPSLEQRQTVQGTKQATRVMLSPNCPKNMDVDQYIHPWISKYAVCYPVDFLSADAIANSTSTNISSNTSTSSGNHLELVAPAAVDELSGVSTPHVSSTLCVGVGRNWL